MVFVLSSIKRNASFVHSMFKLEDQAANLLTYFLGAVLAFGAIPSLSFGFVLGLIAALCSLLGTNLLNQITDIEIDRINKPHRPLPSGKVSRRAALAITAILYAAAATAAFSVSTQVFNLTIAYLLLGAGYSIRPVRFKDRFLLSNLSIALWYNVLNFMMGWVVFRPLEAAPFSLMALLFLYDVIAINSKDYADLEGDRKHNAKTLVVLLGRKRALMVDAASHLAVQSAFLALGLSGALPFYVLVLSLIVVAGTSVIFLDVHKNSDYGRFYHLSFSMHAVLRVALLAMFFTGLLQS
jgi:4-hydroxybenzoate polyprenyltransferase